MRTAVIGAGLAGLTVAIQRRASGDDVTLFEKARGPGGRASTRRAEPCAFDHGAQYFTARDPRFAALVKEWCRAGVVAPWTAPIHTLSRGQLGPDPNPGARYVGVPRMSALTRHLAGDLVILSTVRIESVERDERGWRLSAEDGAVHAPFDHVLVATPAPQAVPLLAARPELARIAAGATLDPCWAVMVTFTDPVEVAFGGAFVEPSPLSWVAAQHSRPGRSPTPAFVLHASAQWSRAHIEDSPEAIVEALVRAFQEALDRRLPDVAYGAAHRWLYALPSTPLARGCLWESASGFGVCGDWLRGARVEDAVLSGWLLADAMADDPA